MFGLFKKQKKESLPIEGIMNHLCRMGYRLTDYGVGVALLEHVSGYSEAEIASHIALSTHALDMREAKDDLITIVELSERGLRIIDVLNSYKSTGLMNPRQWESDLRAVANISAVHENQESWIDKVLDDDISGKERLAYYVGKV